MPGADDFIQRTQYLSDQVGTGRITAGCTVDQPHAQNQHETESFDHTVGRSHYLGGPLMENAFNLVDGMARAVITQEGSRIQDEMRDIADDLTDYVRINAPKDPDAGDVLALSGSAFVVDGGERHIGFLPLCHANVENLKADGKNVLLVVVGQEVDDNGKTYY